VAEEDVPADAPRLRCAQGREPDLPDGATAEIVPAGGWVCAFYEGGVEELASAP
jgi:hypothetical protein